MHTVRHEGAWMSFNSDLSDTVTIYESYGTVVEVPGALLLKLIQEYHAGELERLREAAALARQPLEAVEADGDSNECLWCAGFADYSAGGGYTVDHAPDCKRQLALAALKEVTP